MPWNTQFPDPHDILIASPFQRRTSLSDTLERPLRDEIRCIFYVHATKMSHHIKVGVLRHNCMVLI